MKIEVKRIQNKSNKVVFDDIIIVIGISRICNMHELYNIGFIDFYM